MRREEKTEIVNELVDKIRNVQNFYLADVSYLSVNELNQLRQLLYEKGISMQVVKNKLVEKALDQAELENQELKDILKGPSSIIFCEKVNEPAKIIKAFRKKGDRPVIKAAYLDESLYIGDDQLDNLTKLKSKEDLIADVVMLLKSPVNNLISGLNSGGNQLAGVLKTLSERNSE